MKIKMKCFFQNKSKFRQIFIVKVSLCVQLYFVLIIKIIIQKFIFHVLLHCSWNVLSNKRYLKFTMV